MAPRTRTSHHPSVPQAKLTSFEELVVRAGIEPESFFRSLRQRLARTPDPVRAANNLHRFLSTGFSTAILHDFHHHPVLLEIALELFSQSQYLSDILVRDPELFRWLTTTNALKLAKTRPDFLSEALGAVQLFTRMEKKIDALKRFQRRELLRIGARDVLREADVVMLTQELSGLAGAVVETVLEVGQHDLASRTGAHFESTLVVIGLGKLGGEELNFSSDIDLLFVYDADGEFDAPQERIRTYHEYYNRLAEFVVRKMTEFTDEGHLYRVDMRLRPEGTAGPLALSRNAYVQYYEMRGEVWERQMLLKARGVAGSRATAGQWLKDLEPFVFPRTVLRNPLQEIASMKRRIEERTDSASNLKLGEGGIRDIEFIVQGLQLILGGTDGGVRHSNTLTALERLCVAGKLSGRDVRILNAAYRFFRTVEHRLQLLHGMQTHSIPGGKVELELLARRLGYPSAALLARELEGHRRRVRVIFDAVFSAGRPKQETHGREVPASSAKTGFLKRSDAEQRLEKLRSAFEPFHDEAAVREVLRLLKKHGAPDWGLANLELLADAEPLRRTLSHAFSNPNFFDLLVLLCSRSRNISLTLAREPLLFEVIAGQPEELFNEGWGWAFLKQHDPARHQKFNEIKTLIRFLLGNDSIERTARILSGLAADVLRESFLRAGGSNDTCLVALGKLGGEEITVGSDLDLLLLFDRGKTSQDAAEGIAKALIEESGRTGSYELDFRLRPEGKSAPLATDIGYLAGYYAGRASLWERQSLTKARLLFGSEELGGRISRLFAEVAYGSPLQDGWKKEAKVMRTKIEQERSGRRGVNLKVGKGGLVDIEFAVQILQLQYGGVHQAIRLENTWEAIRAFSSAKILSPTGAQVLERNLSFLRSLETMVRLNTGSPDALLPESAVERQAVAAGLGMSTVEQLSKRIAKVRKENRRILNQIFRGGRG